MGKSNEAEMRELLDSVAEQIAGMYSNPSAWRSWLVYLFERLEAQASSNPAQKESFKEMLVSLQDMIRNRLKTGGW